jgi:6-phosphogluconolactonase
VTVAFEVHPDPEAVAQRAASLIAEVAPQTVALSGGSSPRRTYTLLGERRALASSDVWFVDERCVPPDNDASNFRLVRATIGDGYASIHRVLGEDRPEEAARVFDEEIVAHLGEEPVFDLCVLGMGPDGHTASLFPDAPELDERERRAVATAEPHFGFRRVTLTLPVLNRARRALFIVTGSDKARAFAAIREGELLPAARVLGATWIVDEAVVSVPARPRRRRGEVEGQESLFDL